MKIEAGMYVRTKEGYIAKCTYIDEELEGIYGFDSAIRRSFGDKYDFIYCKEQENYIIKASHNIIDLIEVGDLIEHKKIGIKQIKDKHDKYIWYSKNHNPLTCDVEDAITYEAFKSEFEVGNISILTKQQFESMSYKLED